MLAIHNGFFKSYLPEKAELCQILSNIDNALQAYQQYLQYAPKDIPALMKLGQLYRDNDMSDNANTVFKLIMECEPENSAAKQLLER